MAERIDDIAKSIERHCELEVFKLIPNRAYGRTFVRFGDNDEAMWLINQPNHGGYIPVTDISGTTVGTQVGNPSTLGEDGNPVYKNSPLGELLIRHTKGIHQFETRKGTINIEIFNSSKYNPNDEELATDLVVQLSDEEKIHTFRTLRHLLEDIRGFNKELDDLRQQQSDAQSDSERTAILDRIDQKERAKKAKLEKAQTFIRKYAELRYQPILDPEQERIKRAEVFAKTVAINGGPGTGKTTTLIQRIKFLMDLSENRKMLSEDERKPYLAALSADKQSKLRGDLSWIFFSPSELLKLFLQNTMTKEGLDASVERLKVWSDHKQELVKAYKLFNTETQRPFLFYRRKEGEDVLLPIESDGLKKVVKAYMDFYLKFQVDKLARIANLNVGGYEWKKLGNSVQSFIKQSADRSIEGIIRLYYNLSLTLGDEAQVVSNQYTAAIRAISAKWILILLKDENRYARVKELLKDKKAIGEDEEEELVEEDFDEGSADVDDFESVLLSRVKSLIRKQALARFDKDTRNTAQDKALLELIPELLEQPEFDQIGQLAFFKKFIERSCKGIFINVYREIPMLYKRFRKANAGDPRFYNNFVSALVKDENKRIHEDEQALLLYVINRLVSRLQRLYPALYASSDHPYVRGHKVYKRNIIGIDEATDFHLVDLLAIRSFGDPELFSLTLSGDLMQRMTMQGIRSWEALETFLKDEEGFRREDMTISYRQSPTLLDIARTIYRQANNAEIAFTPFIARDESEPRPLRFQSEDEGEKVEWLAERILEIYKAYGDSIPSIAIFTQDDEKAETLAKAFGAISRLTDVSILAKACKKGEVLGNENAVRIFAVPYIKGLEFEAVFFHNIDSLEAQDEMLYKYLYVALSRAAFFLAVTHTSEFTGNASYLNESFILNQNWK